MKCRFGGINISTDKPHETLEFYRKLGFRVLQEPSEPWFGAMIALQLSAGQTPVIWIWRRGDNEQKSCCNQLTFMTDGHMDETYAQITASGIECEPPFTAAWGGRELILHDPAGNELLFL